MILRAGQPESRRHLPLTDPPHVSEHFDWSGDYKRSPKHFDSDHERGVKAAEAGPSQKGYSEPLRCIDTNQFVGSSRGFDDVFS